jgi:hypothetical protein
VTVPLLCRIGLHRKEVLESAHARLQETYEQWATDPGARDKSYYEEVDRIRAEGSLYRCRRCGREWRG